MLALPDMALDKAIDLKDVPGNSRSAYVVEVARSNDWRALCVFFARSI
jgi:hypothetical protein